MPLLRFLSLDLSSQQTPRSELKSLSFQTGVPRGNFLRRILGYPSPHRTSTSEYILLSCYLPLSPPFCADDLKVRTFSRPRFGCSLIFLAPTSQSQPVVPLSFPFLSLLFNRSQLFSTPRDKFLPPSSTTHPPFGYFIPALEQGQNYLPPAPLRCTLDPHIAISPHGQLLVFQVI